MLSTIDWYFIHVVPAGLLCLVVFVAGFFAGAGTAIWMGYDEWKKEFKTRVDAEITRAVHDTEIRCQMYYEEQLASRPDGTH